MNEEALQQIKYRDLYKELIEHFGGPIKIALAFEFIHDDSEIKDRKKACSRVGMWAHMGVPKKYAAKADELIGNAALTGSEGVRVEGTVSGGYDEVK